MGPIAADLREAEGLLRRAQGATGEERLWLLTVAWQLLHDLTRDLAGHRAAREPVATGEHLTAIKEHRRH